VTRRALATWHYIKVVLDLGRCPEARFGGEVGTQCLRQDPVTQVGPCKLEALEYPV
jgi:hypothetical protein